VILTGTEIYHEVRAGHIVIDGFTPDRLEPNSYGFRLGHEILRYQDEVLDVTRPARSVRETIGPEGYLLEPGKFYLGSTAEAMGSPRYAATLYANRSVSTLGIWIQFSAPLGHCGAVFPWTLEIAVAGPVRVYAGMLVGKLAFWSMQGEPMQYQGRYVGSRSVVASRISIDAFRKAEGQLARRDMEAVPAARIPAAKLVGGQAGHSA
jgi:dCTP deaminase